MNINKGRPLTLEHKKAISEALKGIPSSLKGCYLSEVTKEKIRISKLGSKNPAYRGGRTLSTGDGYYRLLIPNHPNANKRGYVLEHRYVMAEYLGRPLSKDEYVHHKNGNRQDNRVENLELFKGRSEHARLHMRTTNKNWVYLKKGCICPHCNKEISVEQITKIF